MGSCHREGVPVGRVSPSQLHFRQFPKPQSNGMLVVLLREEVSSMPAFSGVPFLSALIHDIPHKLPLFLDLTHEALEKEGPVPCHPYAFRNCLQRELQPDLPQKPAIDDQQQPVQRPRRQKMQNLVLDLPVPKLLLPVNLLSMGPYERGGVCPHILTLQLIDELEMVVLPLVVVAKDIDEQPQDLGHEVSQDDGDGDEDENHEDTLYWVFGGDVAVSYGCDHCDTEVHYVGVHLRPGQDQRHVVERPAVVDPAQVGSVRTVVVVAVYPKTDQVEGYAHVVSVDYQDYGQFDAEISSIEGDVELRHALELYVDATHRVKLDQPHHFEPVGVDPIDQQRDDDCHPGRHIDEHLQIQVVAKDDRDISHKQSLLIVRLYRRNEYIQQKHQHEEHVQAQDVVHLSPPEFIAESNQEPDLQDEEDDDCDDHGVPDQQQDVLRPDYDAQSRVEGREQLEGVFGGG